MRILVLFKKWEGGVGTVMKSIKKELEKRGHEIEFISRQNDLKKNSFFKSIFSLRKIVKEKEKKINYEIIYTQDWSLAFPLLFPKPLFKKKHFCCFHGKQPWFFSSIMQKIVGNLLGNKLIVVGDSLKKKFPKSNLVYNGVDIKQFHNLRNERKYFGWIKKDYDLKKEGAVRKMAKKYNLPFIIAEDIPFEKMNEWYNSLKIFASFPPKYTGFNMSWLEAKAAGVPIILGNGNGIDVSRIQKLKKIPNEFMWECHVRKLLNIFKKEPILINI